MAGGPEGRSRGIAVPSDELGLRRVQWVRVVLGAGRPLCQVFGTSARRPVVREVPLRTAAALIAAGVPAVVRSPGGPEARARDAEAALADRGR